MVVNDSFEFESEAVGTQTTPSLQGHSRSGGGFVRAVGHCQTNLTFREPA